MELLCFSCVLLGAGMVTAGMVEVFKFVELGAWIEAETAGLLHTTGVREKPVDSVG